MNFFGINRITLKIKTFRSVGESYGFCGGACVLIWFDLSSKANESNKILRYFKVV